jgi:hypothetical protein
LRPFNSGARHDRTLFEAPMSGDHALHGFTNREVREELGRRIPSRA